MTVLSDFVEECRTRYLDSNRPRVIIHLSDSGMISPAGEWGNVKTKTRRPLNTLALEPGVMDTLLADVKEFLDVEGWYAEAGIPHHRGYLLHGPPGTGKSKHLSSFLSYTNAKTFLYSSFNHICACWRARSRDLFAFSRC
jgi:mitochondrial chaperone BCS1